MKYILFVGENTVGTENAWAKGGLSDLLNIIQSGWKIFAQPAHPVGQNIVSSAF